MKKIIKSALCLAFLTLNTITVSFAEITIDNVFSSLTENKVTTGDFVQEKSSAKIKRPLKSSGNFIFSEDGIVWKTTKPFPSTMAVTKDSIIQTGADGKKSVIDASANDTFKTVSSTLTSLFSGNRSELEKHFTIKNFKADSAAWEMVLTPKDATVASALKQVTLSGAVKSSKTSLDGMVSEKSDTEKTKFTFANQVYKQALSADEKALFQK